MPHLRSTPGLRTAPTGLALAALLVTLGACGPAGDDGTAGPDASTNADIDTTPEAFGGDGLPRFTAIHAGDRDVITVTIPLREDGDRWIRVIRLLDGDDNELGKTERSGPGRGTHPVTATFDVPAGGSEVTAEMTSGAGTTWRRTWRMR